MARGIAALLFLLACGSCMEMRETVERMVMVRTTGSDLQPAATGYIYKKETDGPASVIKMGESEVIEHFTKMYAKPEAFKAPLPAATGPFYGKEEDGERAATHITEEHIKPVSENEHDDRIDGIASENYDKIFEDYTKKYGSGFNNDFSDYLHGIGHYDHGIYHGHEGGLKLGLEGYHGYGDQGYKGYVTTHHNQKGSADNYHSEEDEGYAASKGRGNKNQHGDTDVLEQQYDHGQQYKGGDHGHTADHRKGEKVDGFHKVFDKNEFKKDHDFYDGDAFKGDQRKYADGHANHGSEAGGYKKGGSYQSGHQESGSRKGGFAGKDASDEHDTAHSSEDDEESHHHGDRKFGIKRTEHNSKGFGIKVKH